MQCQLILLKATRLEATLLKAARLEAALTTRANDFVLTEALTFHVLASLLFLNYN